MKKKAVTYLRLSKRKKGDKEPYSIEAQRADVAAFYEKYPYYQIAEFSEIESAKRNDREELEKAIDTCRRHRATLIISRLDRLGRRVSLISTLIESQVHFRVVQYPDIDPKETSWVFQVLSVVAEMELKNISQRTAAGLKVAKQRGVILGANGRDVLSKANAAAAVKFAEAKRPIVVEIMTNPEYRSLRAIAERLNEIKEPTARDDGSTWHSTTVAALLKKLNIKTARQNEYRRYAAPDRGA